MGWETIGGHWCSLVITGAWTGNKGLCIVGELSLSGPRKVSSCESKLQGALDSAWSHCEDTDRSWIDSWRSWRLLVLTTCIFAGGAGFEIFELHFIECFVYNQHIQ